ncbi:glycosyltransferase involved in cell wall biosynthesis [Actinomycetospora succinea]|uniref:Glycosyltransferase involved in cell wall biosynthesis n=1 Tax=Actinomycetospora succinea TaxID=663603 RepID=A0A4R6UYY2_9PSEU|nr:glycosyltransferase family 4 protein [Actinomycetospora succinea]TDQ48894.1 glycosyltransferase involved in cell wall biosynthesis [Actinomycetospora succinea]
MRPVAEEVLVSGGDLYDARVIAGLRELGWSVDDVQLPGAWPRPGPSARDELDAELAGGDGPVLLDGLVACGVPDVVVPHAARRPLAVLVHLPLGVEQPDLDAGERAVLRAAWVVIATSPWTARRVGASVVATPGVDPAPLATGSDGAHHLLCLGAVTPTKGQDLLVEALAALREHPWTLDLVGPTGRAPGFVADLRAAIDHHGLADRVRIPGPRTGAELDAIWDATDLLVAPSRVETYGMVVTEALARGIPVVASAVGGLPDTAANGGVLTPPEDVPALVATLYRWFADRAHRDGLRISASSQRCSLHPWTQTSRRVDRALAELLEFRPLA